MSLGIQLHLSGSKKLEPEVVPVENCNGANGTLIKPLYGLWTSTFQTEEHTSDWVEWCRYEYSSPLRKRHWFLLTPAPSARVYTIDSYADLARLAKRYRRQFDGALERLTSRYLDYERIALDYDALHLTERGQERTRLSMPLNLYGWGCESTLWFRWCFENALRIEARVKVGKS